MYNAYTTAYKSIGLCATLFESRIKYTLNIKNSESFSFVYVRRKRENSEYPFGLLILILCGVLEEVILLIN